MQAQPRVVELFSGCGGFSLGAHAAGLSPQLAFDVDPILTSSLSRNFPATKLVLADLAKTAGSDIRRHLGGPIDGIYGGPPCQAFSEIGRRKSNDPRRLLLGHFFRLVRETNPAFFVMENVKGLGHAHARPVLNRALDLVPGKYRVIGPLVLDAADFGAATRRLRLFVIGYDPSRVDPISEQSIRATQTPPTTVRSAIADLSSAHMVEEDEGGFDIWKITRPGRPSKYASGLRTPDGTFTGHRGTEHTPAVVRRFRRLRQGEVDAVGRHPRLSWDGQCPTLRAGTGMDRGKYQAVRPIHPDEPRVITVREAARLQGFPDYFRFHPTVWHSFRMIGNSVSPIVAKALFDVIARSLGNSRHIAAE